GMLTQVRLMNYKKARNGNSRYCRFKLEDFTGAAECVMWADEFARFKDQVAEDHICFVVATVERNRDQPGLIVSGILTVDQAQRERTTGLVVDLNLETDDAQVIDRLAGVLRQTPGRCPVFLFVRDGSGKILKLKAGDEFRVDPNTLQKAELEMV